jgi:prepilin-type processing-associated H-X9-DG protein
MRIAMLCLCLMASIFAQDQTQPRKPWPLEPESFKGVKFFVGSEAEAKNLIPKLACVNGTCITQIDVDGWKIDVNFSFVDGHLRSVVGQFDSENFTSVRQIFVEKYGTPSQDNHSEVRTRMGVQYTQETLLWTGDSLSLNVSKFGSKIDKGFFGFIPTKDIEDQLRKAEEAKKKALN